MNLTLSDFAYLFSRFWFVGAILLGVLVVIGLATGIVRNPIEERPLTPAISLPLVSAVGGSLRPGALASDPAISADGTWLYYLSDLGTKFYKFNLKGGEVTPLDHPVFASIQRVVWSPDRSKAIFEVANTLNQFKNLGSPLYDPAANSPDVWWSYDFSSKKLTRLPDAVRDAAWLGQGEQVVLTEVGSDNQSVILVLAKPDGSSPQTLVDAGPIEGLKVWGMGLSGRFIYYPEIDGPAQTSLFSFDLATKKGASLLGQSPGNISDAIVSPSGTRAIFDVADATGSKKVYLADLGSGQIKDLSVVGQTAVAAWSPDEKFAYFVSPNPKSGANSIWRVTPEGQVKEISLPQEARTSISDLVVSPQNVIFYVSQRKLYSFPGQ